jgi:UDP-2,3-diacylglucosamine pyrophosphatase LpxH
MALRTLELNVTKPKIHLYWLNDLHVGAPACRIDRLVPRIKQIASDPFAKVILNGDYGDFIHSTDPRYTHDEVADPFREMSDQYIKIRELLLPIKDKIIAVGEGNHEFTMKKYAGFDITYMLSRDLDVPMYNDLALIKVKVGNHVYRVLTTHGATPSNNPNSALNWLKRVASDMVTQPDIIAMGHVHQIATQPEAKHNDDLKTTKIRYVALTGHYYDTYHGGANYGSRKLFSPTPFGCVMFELHKDGQIIDHKIIEAS